MRNKMAFFMCLRCGEKNSNLFTLKGDTDNCNRCGWLRPPRRKKDDS